MKELKVISVDELHNSIREFIIESNAIIGDYEDMKALILEMRWKILHLCYAPMMMLIKTE
jgi:hypothetical protein